MRIKDILCESTPRTLYHGTLKRNLPAIMDYGLLPQVGSFTSHAYDEYRKAGIPLANVVFAADRQGLGKCISAIIGQMRHEFARWDMHKGWDDLDVGDFYRHAALLVFKRAEHRFTRHSDDIGTDHPPQVEPDDYYHHGADMPNFVLTDDKLRAFLRRNGIRLADYGIVDDRADQAELTRLRVQGKIP
jgi:hypothetical protein